MIQSPNSQYYVLRIVSTIFLITTSVGLLSGCEFASKKESLLARESQFQFSDRKSLTKVDVAIASATNLGTTLGYIGTTQPITELSVRSQASGTLVNLFAEIGDPVKKGQVVGQIDDSLLLAVVNQEQAELASLESELTRAKIEVKNAEIRVESAVIELEQARNDKERYQDLAQQGLIPQKEAESFATAAKVAQKTLLLAQESVNIAQQAVTSATSRVAVQKSVVAESIQRQAYTNLIAETQGIVTQKVNEKGNLVREGEEVLKIGNFEQIKVAVLVSELDLANVAVGKTVEVQLDAFPHNIFTGRVSRIAPVANIATRQIPLEILISNPNNLIKGGLLARVNFIPSEISQLTIPEFAIIQEAGNSYVFVVSEENVATREAKVTKRQVQLGDISQQEVEIIKGIKSGEKIVIRSSKPLTDGETVGLSILSE